MRRRIGKVIPEHATIHEQSSRRLRAATLAAISLTCAACNREVEQVPPVRMVRTFTVEPPQRLEDSSFSGHIEAQDQVSLSFRISGRLAERNVGIGARVGEGETVARLDPENELNNLRSARAALIGAQGVLRKMENQHQRQSHLLERGVTTRADFEAVEQARTAALAQVAAAQASVRTAQDIVSFTTLKADAPGVVIGVGAEPAEVVAAGSMVVKLARREGRDAVFELSAEALQAIPADAPIHVALTSDLSARARGHVREVAPQADPITRTFRVRVGLSDPPASFRLGASVSGTIRGADISGIRIPAAALTRRGQDTGVWIVDPKTQAVSLRQIEVLSADPATALVGKGLALGDIIAAAGANQLKDGQIVRLAGVETPKVETR